MSRGLVRIQKLTNQLTASDTAQVGKGAAIEAVPTDAKVPPAKQKHGGQLVAKALAEQGVKVLFTLTGGHIAPILVGSNQAGIRVVDVRDEVTTVFAADAVSRLSGIPGVAVVTAGPGLTNTITAVKNAQMAQSPVIILAGATSMLLKGRGSLQDIDQLALMKPHVKWMVSIKTVAQIIPAIRAAFRISQEGVPGPVFIEFPLDVLWPEESMTETLKIDPSKSLSLSVKDLNKSAMMQKLQQAYLQRYVKKIFKDAWVPPEPLLSVHVNPPQPENKDVTSVLTALRKATKPIILIGSQAIRAREVTRLRDAIEKLGCPVYLSGMGRGLLGKENRLQMRHKRGAALGKADFILLAGVPADFRLNYGRDLNKSAYFATVNLDSVTLTKNNDIHKPHIRVHGDPLSFLIRLSDAASSVQNLQKSWSDWFKVLGELQVKREQEIAKMASSKSDIADAKREEFVNPLRLCKAIDAAMDEDSVIVADGGDFVGTASYILRPRSPLSWLDPGVFGTLGVGAGFLMGAKIVRPQSEVWAMYGDGSVGWSLAEFDTFVRHKIPIIAVIGNDACWMQMFRDQVRLLGDPVACELNFSNYQDVVKGLGAEGILIRKESELAAGLQKAKELAKQGKPVLVNVLINRSAFREGSISL